MKREEQNAREYLQRLTGKAEELQNAVEIMKKMLNGIRNYCTDDCKNCPIRHNCEDGWLDLDADFSIEMMADFIEYSRDYDDRAFEAEWNSKYTREERRDYD